MRLALLALLALAACAHAPPPEFSHRVRQGRCEDAVSFLRAHPRGPTVESRLKQVVTVPLSYVLTGVGYTAEVAVVVGGGIVASGVVCAPIFMIEGAAGGGGDVSGECMTMVLGSMLEGGSLPGVGRGIHKATKDWRCADMSPVSEDLRAIAECYAWRGAEGDLEKARQQLDVLTGSEELMRCVSKGERAAVERDVAFVRDRLAGASAPVGVQ